jgi:hypothetical protein
MVTARTAIAARRAALPATAAANVAMARRTRLRMENLATFLAAMGKAQAVDDWLTEEIGTLRQ